MTLGHERDVQAESVIGHQGLIERLEKATGPDHELDGLIWWKTDRQEAERCYWQAATGMPRPLGDDIPPGLGRSAVRMNAPDYTTSIDDALTLVPEGAGLSLERHWVRVGVEWTAAIFTGGVPDNPARQFTADAPAPAIALCIAALRARIAMTAQPPAKSGSPS